MEKRINKNDPVPAYHQLRLILEDEIRKGKYKIGGLFPTEVILSKEYLLSRVTIRQALGELEKEGFILREKGRGTFVIRTESTKENHAINIGVIIYKPALEIQWFLPEYISGMDSGFEGKMVNLILLPFDEKTAGVKERRFLSRMIAEKELKGLIITAEELDTEEVIRLRNKRFPFILVNLYPAEKTMNYICPDFDSGIRKVAEYLISLGHRKIAFIGTLFSRYHLEAVKRQSFMQTMQRKSFEPSSFFVKEAEYLGANVFSLVKELLREKMRPTAIVCSDDPLAVKVINTLRDAKITVPEEISVTGFNDLRLAQLSRPALTTLRIPCYEMGKEAAEFLHRVINKGAGSFQKIVPLELVIRDSTGKV